jgi:hypothetical protein
MTNLKKNGGQFYTKWEITDDLSLRYYYLFQDRKAYEGKYYLKSHKKKDYIEIDSLTIVDELIKSSKSVIDIVGKQVDNQYIKYMGTFGDQVLIGKMKYSTPKDK